MVNERLYSTPTPTLWRKRNLENIWTRFKNPLPYMSDVAENCGTICPTATTTKVQISASSAAPCSCFAWYGGVAWRSPTPVFAIRRIFQIFTRLDVINFQRAPIYVYSDCSIACVNAFVIFYRIVEATALDDHPIHGQCSATCKWSITLHLTLPWNSNR